MEKKPPRIPKISRDCLVAVEFIGENLLYWNRDGDGEDDGNDLEVIA